MRRSRRTAFLAALLMLSSIVLLAPAAHAKEKNSEAAPGAAAPVEHTKATPVAKSRSVAADEDTTASGTAGRLAKTPPQKKSTSSPSRAAAASKPEPVVEASSRGGGASKKSAPANSSSTSTTTTTSATAGNPKAGCYELPANSDTGHGANQRGVYDSTCDGSASRNGSGAGAAVGRPCAGCVGKADYKNPPGQMPNAQLDGNRGYECDNNQGIGKTNPAHTGCKTGAVNPPPVVDNPPGKKPPKVNPPGNKPPKVNPPGQPPQGKPPVENPPPQVGPGREDKPSVPDEVLPQPRIERDVLQPAPEPQPVVVRLAPAGALPVTGGDAWLLLLVGCGLIGSGWMALLSLPLRGRRPSTV